METSTLIIASVVAGAVLLIAISLFGGSSSKNESSIKKTSNESSTGKVVYQGKLSVDEIAKHSTESDAWIIVDGKVYDVTDYIDLHPGGDAILRNAGLDSSEGFHGTF
jgi:cytochrome b involved in lipid metabolism